MTALRLFAIAWLGLCLVCATAHAQGDPRGAPADLPALRQRLQLREPLAPRLERTWYGWQTLLADAVTGSVLFGLLASDPDDADPVVAALVAWGLATPIVHAVHGNLLHGGASILLRAGAVGLSYLTFIFAFIASWNGSSAAYGFVWVAIAGSIIGVAAIDAAALAYTERRVAPSTSGLWIGPFADRATRTFGLTLRGAM